MMIEIPFRIRPAALHLPDPVPREESTDSDTAADVAGVGGPGYSLEVRLRCALMKSDN